MLDWLRKVFSPRQEPEVEYRPTDPDPPPVIPAGPPTSPQPPGIPLESPDVPDEPDRQR